MNTLESCTIPSPGEIEEVCAKFTIDEVLSPFVLHGITTVDEKYTLGLWIKSEAEGEIHVRGKIIPTTTSWVRHVHTFVANDVDLKFFFNATGTYYIYHPKLESGSKDTDWTEAPEDVYEEINETAAGLHTTIINQSTAIIEESKEIILTALDSYVETNTGHFINAVTNYYLASSLNEDVDISTEGWTEEIPTLSADTPYLWAREVLTYSDKTSSEDQPILIYTYVDSAITSITEYYGMNSDEENPVLVSDSGEETDLEWYTVVPTLSSSNKCLWHYEVLTLADDTQVETAKRYIGAYKYSYSEFRDIVETQLKVLAGEIVMSFERATGQITDLEDSTNEKLEPIGKYFVFNENGLEIKTGENAISLVLDSDLISFQKNGEQFGWWDGVDFHTGNIIVDVNERAQFGNFAFVPRSDGSLMFLKVK